jgi:hypothetical protein
VKTMAGASWGWRGLALASVMLLGSCTPAPIIALSITNNSGQRISFESCRHERFVLEPGGRVELVDQYWFLNPEVSWSCYRKKPLVVRTAQGGEWRYLLKPLRNAASSRDGMTIQEFTRAGAAARSDTLAFRSRFFVDIERDGSIRAGRRADPADPESLEFPADPQPRGFPILPAR